jgi:hypothetical protein
MKNFIYSLQVLIVVCICSCNSTKISTSWKANNKQVNIDKLGRVLVVALFKNEESSHYAEDQMVKFLRGKGIVSYQFLHDNTYKNSEQNIKQKTSEGGFDGAITMRLIDVVKEPIYNPNQESSVPLYYQNFSGYYYRSWGYYTTPNYYSMSKTYVIETNVYSLKQNKIIWSGTTTTVDPNGVDKMTKEIAKVVYKRMLSEGFISEE